MKKVLVTGADGFIGSHLVETLVKRGFSVRAFCCYNSFNSWGWLNHSDDSIKDRFEVILGDIRDGRHILEAMAGCDSVIHLAALIAIPYSYHAAETFVDVNIKGTLNVVEAARKLGIKKIVHTSTSETYGSAQFVPMNEEHPMVAQSPYAASKVGADQIAMSYCYSFDVPVAVARPFNTFGPRQSLRAVIPTIICQLLDKNKYINLGSTGPRRDFSYVDDTVNGIIAIHDNDAAIGQVINIGSGYDISIAELAILCKEITGSESEINVEEKRKRPVNSEVERLLCDNSKALELLGWAPSMSGKEGLVQGLEKFTNWLRDPKNRARYVNANRFVI